ncbi:FtsW/RodA/SpoVE family cell cycle protein, partial [Candidatus Falkowbacteria bacterium]|nr:FtsW/RodA/SpoVE family cell cycle protein [Candidatus Falkowbacteria bacterium]
LIITLISLIVYFVGGGRLKHLALIIIAGIAVLAVLVSINSYQANRFKCLINANLLQYKQDICYQVNQSLIAVGSGGFWGRGLGASRQKYAYLPEVKGDSIFAIIGEETGLIFSVALVILYLFFFYRGFLIAKHSSDDFGRILAIGIVSWITFQALINIGGMINLIPLTGVTLPFISFGGTSLMVNLGVVGILVNISKHGRGVKITNYQL